MNRFMKRLPYFALALGVMAVSAIAQTTVTTPDVVMNQPVIAPDSGISIPIAVWLQAISDWVIPIISVAVLWLIRKLPSQIAGILTTLRVDQLLEKAIAYAINTVVGASKDKTLNVSTGNQVVDKALQFIVTNAPAWMIKWMGDGDAIRQKIIARLNIDDNVALPSTEVPKAVVNEVLK